MFSTPLMACSSGVATVRATTSAEAPGYAVVIWTVGGTMFGYWATGRNPAAASPNTMLEIPATAAKRGRRQKKYEGCMHQWRPGSGWARVGMGPRARSPRRLPDGAGHLAPTPG